MDVSAYLPMFLAEAREHLQELNLAIVRVEEDPNDRATVDEIFRIAHSLKGMSATMGFDAMASLTHQMEDVLELLRQRRGGLEHEAIDTLLECLDALEGAVASIETDGAESLDAAPLVERLRALVREQDEQDAATGGESDGGDRGAVETAAEGAGAGVQGAALHVRVRLAADTQMPAVRAYQLLEALGAAGTVVRSTPAADALDRFTGRDVEVWLEAAAPAAEIEAAARKIPDVDRATVEEHDAAATRSASTAHGRSGATVRVDADRLDLLMHLMGELVVERTRVESLAAEAAVPGLSQAVQDLTRTSQALQTMVMQVRMIPVDAVFVRLPRLVRDLSSKLGKKVDLRLGGRDTELDRTVVEALGDPLVHLVRNALDHGLESPADRVAAGKPETGTLEIAARHAGGNVVIEVRDDGAGVDPARVARKAVERGLLAPEDEAQVDVAAALELLFSPGFSTAEVRSDVSGRGVGMDAVRTAVRGLGGEVLLSSEPGAGTVAEIRLPLTLAIVAALLVDAGGQPFAIPLDRVERTLRLAEQTVRSVAGWRMLVLRDEALPLIDAADAFSIADAGEPENVVIVHAGEQRVALAVSRLVGQRELVTRPLPAELAGRAALSGGAVLANGDIALIVDCDALARLGGSRSSATARPRLVPAA